MALAWWASQSRVHGHCASRRQALWPHVPWARGHRLCPRQRGGAWHCTGPRPLGPLTSRHLSPEIRTPCVHSNPGRQAPPEPPQGATRRARGQQASPQPGRSPRVSQREAGRTPPGRSSWGFYWGGGTEAPFAQTGRFRHSHLIPVATKRRPCLVRLEAGSHGCHREATSAQRHQWQSSPHSAPMMALLGAQTCRARSGVQRGFGGRGGSGWGLCGAGPEPLSSQAQAASCPHLQGAAWAK